jgi:hypothetical protein
LFEQLAGQNPDALLMPEHQNVQYQVKRLYEAAAALRHR